MRPPGRHMRAHAMHPVRSIELPLPLRSHGFRNRAAGRCDL